MEKSRVMWAFALFSAVLMTEANGQPADSESFELKEAFVGLGYEVTQLDGCRLAYMRRIQPTEENNGYFAVWRYINLDSIQDFSSAEVFDVTNNGVKNFLIELKFDDNYDELFFPVFRFNTWVREQYPEANWPYPGAMQHDRFSAELEFELHRRVEHVAAMNRRISFSKYGSVTYVEGSITSIAAQFPEELKNLRDAIRTYAATRECDIEN